VAKVRNPPAKRILVGSIALNLKLNKLKAAGANRIARKALTKALRIGVKGVKANVPSQYKGAKKAIGWRMDQKGGKKRNEHRAKLGAGVGKGYSAAPSGKRKGTGVGIGGRNIHWFIQGTAERTRKKIGGSFAKYNKTATSKSTGEMPAVLKDVVKGGFKSSAASMNAVIRQTVIAELEKEAAKKK